MESGRGTIRLPSDSEERLENLAKATGRTKTFYAREAIVAHLDDGRLVPGGTAPAECRSLSRCLLKDIDDVMAWRIEFDRAAERELSSSIPSRQAHPAVPAGAGVEPGGSAEHWRSLKRLTFRGFLENYPGG